MLKGFVPTSFLVIFVGPSLIGCQPGHLTNVTS